MWNNGNDCSCLWIILIIILLCCCCGGNSGMAGNSCACQHTGGRSNFGCAGSNECCC